MAAAPATPNIALKKIDDFRGIPVYCYKPIHTWYIDCQLAQPTCDRLAHAVTHQRSLQSARYDDYEYYQYNWKALLEGYCMRHNSLRYIIGSIEQFWNLVTYRPPNIRAFRIEYPEQHTELMKQGIEFGCSSTVLNAFDYMWSKTQIGKTDDVVYTEIIAMYKKCFTEDPTIFEMLYHSVNSGIIRHVGILCEKLPQKEYAYTELTTTDGLNIPLLQIATKHPEVLTILASKVRINSADECTLEKYKDWYRDRQFMRTIIDPNLDAIPNTDVTFRDIISLHRFNQTEDLVARFKEVRETVIAFMNEIVSHDDMPRDLYRSIKPILVGSSNENTRFPYPDEFDFLLVIDAKDDPSSTAASYKYQMAWEFLNPLIDKLKTILKSHSQTPFNGKLVVEKTGYFHDKSKFSNIFLTWRDNYFKDMEIKIDIVPVIPVLSNQDIQIPNHSFRPNREPKLYKSVHNSSMITEFDVAFSCIENDIVKEVPKQIHQGYKLAKSMRHASLLTPVLGTLTEAQLDYVYDLEEFIPSYWLKTCLLFATHSLHASYSEPKADEIYWAFVIFRQLRVFVEGAFLPHYFFSADPKRVNECLFYCKKCFEKMHGKKRIDIPIECRLSYEEKCSLLGVPQATNTLDRGIRLINKEEEEEPPFMPPVHVNTHTDRPCEKCPALLVIINRVLDVLRTGSEQFS